jgi:hypothetical protein
LSLSGAGVGTADVARACYMALTFTAIGDQMAARKKSMCP